MTTIRDIAAAYDARRDSILAAIRAGEFSASMSGLDYYPKPWAELDMADAFDVIVISANLAGDEYEGFRKRSPAEMAAEARRRDLLSQPANRDRHITMKAISREIANIRIAEIEAEVRAA